MTTLKDLSKHLGISVTQVSRALNDHDDVSQKTKEKVRAGAKELGYSANLTARSLVTGRTGMICLIRTGHIKIPEEAPVFGVITGLSQEFTSRGLQFVLNMTPADVDPVLSYEKAINSKSFDGFVLIEAQKNDPRIALLEATGTPFVMHGRTGVNPTYPYFDVDNVQIAYHQTKHLTQLGHKKIALLNGHAKYAYSGERLAGFERGLDEVGEKNKPDWVSWGSMTEDRGMISTISLFEGAGEQPTALVCSNILLAKGAYKALEAMGLNVPGDVSVVAHDDVLRSVRASAFYPALTVTRSPFDQSWSHLADILCGLINGDDVQKKQIMADFEFVARASTAPPK